jgi:hypothetical protein
MSSDSLPSDSFLTECAAEIRRLGSNVVRDVIAVGQKLTEAKAQCPHGEWLAWLEREFRWSDRTALNFMRLYELSKNFESFANLADASIFLSETTSRSSSLTKHAMRFGGTTAALASSGLGRPRRVALKSPPAAVLVYPRGILEWDHTRDL